MKKILMATDFSSAAFNGANYAADMAAEINTGLVLLHVYQPPASYSELPSVIVDQDFIEHAEASIKELKGHLILRANGEIDVETRVITGGFYEELVRACKSIDPYAVIIGTQGKTAAETILFGSHAVHAMKHLQWPLIAVPPKARYRGVKRVGLACDLVNVAATIPAIEVKKLVQDFNAELHILNTGKNSEFSPEVVFESGLLQEMFIGIKPNYHFITSSDVDEGIIDFAGKNHIDLLIVVPKRHGLIDKLLHKSHTRQLVLHSHVPVMALHE
jgi:nucleotide-binding universal stress UspA family protein